MKLGILADIHEHVEELRKTIHLLRKAGAERFVILGDICGMGDRLDETIELLREVEAVGVWGNHDFGLCFRPADVVRHRHSAAVLDFMGGLRPSLEIDGCLFTHVEPWLDPHKVEDLWYFEGSPDSREKLARSFAAVPQRVLFIGHMHRWLLATPDGILPWRGDQRVRLDRDNRHLIVIHAVCRGRCALFETNANELVPFGDELLGELSA
jgi:hypothetical protein